MEYTLVFGIAYYMRALHRWSVSTVSWTTSEERVHNIFHQPYYFLRFHATKTGDGIC